MAKSKLPTAKTRKLSKRAKTHQPAGSVKTNKTRMPGDIELSERDLKRITGGRAMWIGHYLLINAPHLLINAPRAG